MSNHISTLLIANRGEIARRITRSAHTMGIRTVAVYADSDYPINEESTCIPISYHGLMHINREFILRQYFDQQFQLLYYKL